MRFLERLFGRRDDDTPPDPTIQRYRRQNAARAAGAGPEPTDDERAIERYRYLLRTAPPETIEAAHAEAFAQLTPDQRRLVLDELGREVPEHELAGDRAAADDPRALARLATRAEMRRPGTLERTFGRADAGGYGFGAPGIGLGGLMAGGFLSGIAGVVIGTAIADAFFLDSGFDQGFAEGFESGEAAGAEDAAGAGETGDTGFGGADAAPEVDASTLGTDFGDPGADLGADLGGDLGTDLGGDFGADLGADFGGDF